MALKRILTVLLFITGLTSFAQVESTEISEFQQCIITNTGCISLPEGQVESNYTFSIESFHFASQSDATKFAGYVSSNLHKVTIDLEQGYGELELMLDDAHAFQSKDEWNTYLNQRCH